MVDIHTIYVYIIYIIDIFTNIKTIIENSKALEKKNIFKVVK